MKKSGKEAVTKHSEMLAEISEQRYYGWYLDDCIDYCDGNSFLYYILNPSFYKELSVLFLNP